MPHHEQAHHTAPEGGSPITPDQVLNTALAFIEPDGTVALFDDVEASWYAWQPHKSVDPTVLPPDVFARRLLEVARRIYATLSAINTSPDRRETELRLLALALTGYRSHPGFLRDAAQLTRISHVGLISYPQLPPGSPWDWAPTRQSL